MASPKRFRLHVLAVPHTVTDTSYSACAFTQKVLKFCAMMHARGHHVIHYGHERSKVQCTEHVAITDDDLLKRAYGDYDWHTTSFKHSTDDVVHKEFNMRAAEEVAKRKAPGDFLLLFWSVGHAHVAKCHANDMFVVEPGIGSYNDVMAPFSVFESYAVMHHNYAKFNKLPRFFDAVIPNYFDPSDFIDATDREGLDDKVQAFVEAREGPSSDKSVSLEDALKCPKGQYVLMISRIIPTKGVQLAIEACAAAGIKLVIIGQGAIKDAVHKDFKWTSVGPDELPKRPIVPQKPGEDPALVTHLGYAEPRERAVLIARAKAVIVPSLYAEPFGGVNVEAQISGVPVVTTDWGAFSETVVHGSSGYRCRSLEQFVWALKNVDLLERAPIRQRALANYSFERVGNMYEEYFSMLSSVRGNRGFYALNESREGLDWLCKAP